MGKEHRLLRHSAINWEPSVFKFESMELIYVAPLPPKKLEKNFISLFLYVWYMSD